MMMMINTYWYPLVMTVPVCHWTWSSRKFVSFPINSMVIFHSFLLNYQRVYHIHSNWLLRSSYQSSSFVAKQTLWVTHVCFEPSSIDSSPKTVSNPQKNSKNPEQFHLVGSSTDLPILSTHFWPRSTVPTASGHDPRRRRCPDSGGGPRRGPGVRWCRLPRGVDAEGMDGCWKFTSREKSWDIFFHVFVENHHWYLISEIWDSLTLI